MCIIAVINHTIPLPNEDVISHCWKLNPDGAGVMYTDQANPDKICVKKGFMSLPSLLKWWRTYSLKPRKHGYTVIHFRIGTSGGKRPSMTHPFDLVKGYQALAHNGILRGLGTDAASDTAEFAKLIRVHMAKYDETWVDNPFLKYMIESAIGSYNKFVILTGSKVTIFNEDSGEIDPMTGIWWSNSGFRQVSKASVCDPREWFTSGIVSKAKSNESSDDSPQSLDFPCKQPIFARPGEQWEYDPVWQAWTCNEGKRAGEMIFDK